MCLQHSLCEKPLADFYLQTMDKICSPMENILKKVGGDCFQSKKVKFIMCWQSYINVCYLYLQNANAKLHNLMIGDLNSRHQLYEI